MTRQLVCADPDLVVHQIFIITRHKIKQGSSNHLLTAT